MTGFDIFLDASGPMPVNTPGSTQRRTILVFVDASRRGDNYRLGGIAFGPAWSAWFSTDVQHGSTDLVPWDAANAINEAEALAALSFVRAIRVHIVECDVMLFIDNQAAEGVLLKSYSSSKHLTVVAALFWSAVRDAKAAAWIGRVPSRLNIADGFSRDDFSVASSINSQRMEVHVPNADQWSFLLDAHVRHSRKVMRQRKHQGQG